MPFASLCATMRRSPEIAASRIGRGSSASANLSSSDCVEGRARYPIRRSRLPSSATPRATSGSRSGSGPWPFPAWPWLPALAGGALPGFDG
ncbi:MAG: hypothetical protein M3680_36595 [Myxococcota bacterium]|nr:hypothetical protein [Myxococcota bacterium]